MIASTAESTVNTPLANSRLFQVLRILIVATPLYVFINALRGR